MMHKKKDCTLINIVTRSGIAATAKIVEELPPIGSVWENDIVAELIPAPLRERRRAVATFKRTTGIPEGQIGGIAQ